MNFGHYPYLNDYDFLQELDQFRVKEKWVKITVLEWFTEEPITEFQGKTDSGNINVNGNSNSRRTASIAFTADSTNYNIYDINNEISINKKINVEIGITNKLNQYTDYPIIWFQEGVFIIKDPSIQKTDKGIKISLSLVDKMALLDGTCGGTFTAVTELNKIDVCDTEGNISTEQIKMYDMIFNLLHEYAGEREENILIDNIDSKIQRLVKWVGDQPLYGYSSGGLEYIFTLDVPSLPTGETYETFNYGDDIGYEYVPFTFAGELTCQAGENVAGALTKIKNLLGNFEFFYDVYGAFHFQEIKNYLNTRTPINDIDGSTSLSNYQIKSATSKTVYSFQDSTLISSISVSPQFSKVRNDFVIWGSRKSATGVDIPIRYHIAIDNKPSMLGNNDFLCFLYEDFRGVVQAKKAIFNKEYASITELPHIGNLNTVYRIPNNDQQTPYYYYLWNGERYIQTDKNPAIHIIANNWRSKLYLTGVENESTLASSDKYYLTELRSEWPKIYDVAAEQIYEEGSPKVDEDGIPYFTGAYRTDDLYKIDYFLDLLEPDGGLSQLSVANIGRRTMAKTNKEVNCIFNKEAPFVYLIQSGTLTTQDEIAYCESKGCAYSLVEPDIYAAIATSSGRYSAYEAMQELITSSTEFLSSVSITTQPIFYLEPNTRISIRDTDTGIDGDFMINSFSIPLAPGGTMTLSCSKCVDKI